MIMVGFYDIGMLCVQVYVPDLLLRSYYSATAIGLGPGLTEDLGAIQVEAYPTLPCCDLVSL